MMLFAPFSFYSSTYRSSLLAARIHIHMWILPRLSMQQRIYLQLLFILIHIYLPLCMNIVHIVVIFLLAPHTLITYPFACIPFYMPFRTRPLCAFLYRSLTLTMLCLQFSRSLVAQLGCGVEFVNGFEMAQRNFLIKHLLCGF